MNNSNQLNELPKGYTTVLVVPKDIVEDFGTSYPIEIDLKEVRYYQELINRATLLLEQVSDKAPELIEHC